MRRTCMIIVLGLFLICNLSTVQMAAGATSWGLFRIPGVGSAAQGAGIAIVNLDSNPRPELILMAYDNSAGTGTKYFRYKIGWNANTFGNTGSWSPVYQVAAVSAEAQGAGVAFVNLDGDPRPEMVLMAYNDVSGTKVFRYKIGWNVGTNGEATSWGSTIQVPGVGSGANGAGIAFANLDGNPRPEIILMAYDNSTGTKNFRYKIGWNVNTAGVATSWSPVYQVAGVVPEVQTKGAGIAFANLDSDPRPEMILMSHEIDQLGGIFKYKIGWNINTSGVATSWDSEKSKHSKGAWNQAQGADLTIYDIDGDGKQDIFLMVYDNSAVLNYFWYTFGLDFLYENPVVSGPSSQSGTTYHK